MSDDNDLSAAEARRLLADRSMAFGFRDGERRRPLDYDFCLPGEDPQRSGTMYEYGRQIAQMAGIEGVDPGFYPEGRPSTALVALVCREFQLKDSSGNDARMAGA